MSTPGLYLLNSLVSGTLPLHILTLGRFSNARATLDVQTQHGFAGVTWPANNRAHYFPVSLPGRFTIARFMVGNGNATGNIDVGIYNSEGTRLLSTGTQSRTGSSVTQYYSVTPQSFPAGNYYLALVVSTTSGSVLGVNLNNLCLWQYCGMLGEALGSTVLPATMTPVTYADDTGFWYGFTQSATV